MAGHGLALFGGTFDPPHRSHRRVVDVALQQLDPARLLVVPCGDPPLKDRPDLTPAQHRVAMCRLAFGAVPRVEVSTFEVERDGPSYTVDTLRHFRAEIGLDEPLFLLIGSDNLPTLPRWLATETLFELATVVTYPRQGHPISDAALRDVPIRFLHKQHLLEHALRDVPVDGLNSTELREALAQGRRPAGVVPEVLAYAAAHGLYGTAPRPG